MLQIPVGRSIFAIRVVGCFHYVALPLQQCKINAQLNRHFTLIQRLKVLGKLFILLVLNLENHEYVIRSRNSAGCYDVTHYMRQRA